VGASGHSDGVDIVLSAIAQWSDVYDCHLGALYTDALTANDLFAWDVDRSGRFPRFDESPYDDDGNDLSLYDPATPGDDITINLTRPRRGELADFLYSPLLLLFVSARVIETIANCRSTGLRAHRMVIRDVGGRVVDDSYVWLQFTRPARILDLERSEYEPRALGGVKSLQRAVVDEKRVPADDLFLCAELNLPMFRGHVVQRILDQRLSGAEFTRLDDLSWPL